MKFGINTLLWTAGFDESNLPLIGKFRDAGFDGIEIARFEFASFPAAAVRRELDRIAIGRVFCSALTGNLSLVSDDPAIRAQAIEFVKAGIRTAAEIGADTFVGPYCAPVGYLPGRRRTADEWKRAVEGLQALGATLDECKVDLAVEPLNRFETYFLNTTADGVRLCEEVAHPRIGLLMDTFHASIEEKDVAAAYRLAGKHIKHVHTCENDRGTPGSGHVPFPQVFAALNEIGYQRWAVIESFGANIPEIAAAACIWRDLAASAEAIAFDGLRYLKGLAAARA